MTKSKSKSKHATLLIASLVANGVFIVLLLAYGIASYVITKADFNIATYNALVSEMCGEKYQSYLEQWGESHGEDGKKVFAATVCLRDYKSGKDLDLEPLLTP